MWDTKSGYLADVEIRGVENKGVITVQWTSSLNVLIEAMISKLQAKNRDTKPDGAERSQGIKATMKE